jgi:hypothetical protein
MLSTAELVPLEFRAVTLPCTDQTVPTTAGPTSGGLALTSWRAGPMLQKSGLTLTQGHGPALVDKEGKTPP